jgi:exopolysaccharide production protein ExoZ
VLNSLQVGRGLAAIVVAAFHLSLMMGERRYGGQPVFQQYTKYGYIGVDFFFVLSGFIILFAHAGHVGKPGAWKGYVWRRFIRLFPIYWLYTGVFVVLLLLGAGTTATMPTTAIDFLTSLTLVRFSAAIPPLPVAWTLFHELAFYALFSLLILNIRIGAAAFGIWGITCLVFFHYAGEPNPFNVYTAASNLYFLFGMAAYFLYRRSGSGLPYFFLGLCVVAAVAVAWPFGYRLAPLLLVSGFAIAMAGVARLESAGHVTFSPYLVFIGNASYSIYLLHESLSGLLLKIMIKSNLHSLLGNGLVYLIVLIGTIALGCLAYSSVEKPLLTWIRRRSQKRVAEPMPAGQIA